MVPGKAAAWLRVSFNPANIVSRQQQKANPVEGCEVKESDMRYSKLFKTMVAGLFLVFSLSALAANSGTLTLVAPAELNGKQLKSGEYKVKWEGQGQDVQVSILQGKHVVATGAAKLVDTATKTQDNTVVLDNSSGSMSIHEIRISGKKQILVFENGAGASAAQTSLR
jgi:hypothetical protein